MSAPLHIRYRPKYLEDIVGNKETVSMVSAILERDLDRIPHTWLFTGSTGTGKTTIARIIKEELGCSDADYHEQNSSDTRGIDTIRETQTRSKFAPVDGKVKVYLFDEVHNWTGAAAEAALKMLEDAPDNVFFLLCTTNPEKLKKTLKSRCTNIKMSTLNSRDMKKLLENIASVEEVGIAPPVLKAIIAASDGSPREAVKLLDSVLGINNNEDAIKAIESSSVSESTVIDLCRALVKGESWRVVSNILKGLDVDAEQVRRAILGYFTKVLLDNDNTLIAQLMECFEEPYFNTGKAGLVLSCYQAGNVYAENSVPF